MPSVPNLLSQQIIAWLLQAAGILAEHRSGAAALKGVGPSTIKNAMGGKPVLRSWEPLLDALLHVVGLTVPAAQREGVAEALRTWDREVSRLDTCGLPAADLLPALLRAVAPAVGVRFGAWAALETIRPTTSFRPVADWLCDPLAPNTFGHAVDWLFVRHHPARGQWVERYPLLVGIDRTTVDDWRSPKLLRVPNVANLAVIAAAMGKENETRSLALLRMARVLAAAREGVAAIGGGRMAEDFASLVTVYARATRGALTSPGVVADVVDQMFAVMLESPGGAAFVSHLAPVAGWRADTNPLELAGAVRVAAMGARDTGELAELLWVHFATLVLPPPLLVGAISVHVGHPAGMQRAVTPPLELVQGEWRVQSFLSMAARGEPCAWSPSVPTREQYRVPSPELRALAQQALDEQRRLVRREGEAPPEPLLMERFYLSLAFEAGGETAVEQSVASLNAHAMLPVVPRTLEPALDDMQITDLPHLMPERARSAALRGDDGEAIAWIDRWARSSAPRSADERRAAADAAIMIAHRHVDGSRSVRAYLNGELPVAFDLLPDHLQAKIEETDANVRRTLSALLRNAEALFRSADGLLRAHSGSPDEVDRLVRLVPLAVRLDLLAADATGEDPYLTRSESLANRLAAPDRALPDHGPAWAMLALWQRVVGEDPSDAVRRATHFGSLAVYDAEVSRLIADHALAQDTR